MLVELIRRILDAAGERELVPTEIREELLLAAELVIHQEEEGN